MIFSFSSVLLGQSLGQIKAWHLKSANREITVKLSSARPNTSHGETVLTLEVDNGSISPTTEEVHLLGQALDEMPSLGYDPRKVEMISTWLQNTKYREGIEHSVAESGKWSSCVGRKYCHAAEDVANRYLEAVDAFKSLDDILHVHGLVRRSVRVDDMGVGKQSDGISCTGLIIIAMSSKE